jgi:hypothetical protein
MSGYSGMGGYGSGGGMWGWGGMGDWGGMGNGWPAMTNWWSGMNTWGPAMANWCWDYTNMWRSSSGYTGNMSNWWGSIGGNSYHTMPLPGSVSPVPIINGLVVMDQNLTPVLSADLADPDSYGYSARCVFTNAGIIPGAQGALQVSATQRSTHLAASATGLAPNTMYSMTFNGAAVTPVATDARGRLKIRGLPNGVTSMRGIGSVSIQDRNSNTILSVTLPPR